MISEALDIGQQKIVISERQKKVKSYDCPVYSIERISEKGVERGNPRKKPMYFLS